MFGYQVLGFGAGGLPTPEVEYLVVAGGGGSTDAGGGAGGYRTNFPGGTLMVLERGTPFPITVGTGTTHPSTRGGNSSMVGDFTIDCTGGGRGGPSPNQPWDPPPWSDKVAYPGGSGGGAAQAGPQAGGGGGNAGSYDPPEGSGGGQNYPPGTGTSSGGAGGGGAAQGGSPSPALTPTGGEGGNGSPNTISGADVTYAGGGGAVSGGGTYSGAPGTGGGPTGVGGGGKGGAGGDGTVILRGPASTSFTVSPGTNTTSTAPGGEQIATFTVSGTVVAG